MANLPHVHQDAQLRPRVVAVVLTWNDTAMTADCIESVLASDYPDLEVVLVDNGSSEPCGERLKARFPDIDLIVLPQNRGFAGGSNAGFERSFALGADYVHLIGNDSTIAFTAISELVRVMEDDASLAAVSPLLFDPTEPDEPRVVQFYYGELNRTRAIHRHFGVGVPFSSHAWPTVIAEFVPFVAVMLRCSALRQVGIFDEGLFTCWEDYDLCIRLADANWRIAAGGNAHVVHKGSATTGRFSPYITYFNTRNRLICLFRHASPGQILRQAPFLLRSFFWQVRRYGFGNWACHKALLFGAVDFLTGVRGVGHAPFDRSG